MINTSACLTPQKQLLNWKPEQRLAFAPFAGESVLEPRGSVTGAHGWSSSSGLVDPVV